MDPTEWIAWIIVAGATVFLIRMLATGKKKKNCCSKGCPLDPQGSIRKNP